MRRLLVRALVFVAGAAIVLGLSAYSYLRASLPALNGSVAVSGISGPVDIIRDHDAITHVFASTRLDTFFGLGYAHAQDRLWQMEFQRRVGEGRLSEILGAPTVATDRFLRTLGTGRAARSAWNALPAATSTPTSRASTPSSPRITDASCRSSSRCSDSSPSRGAGPTCSRGSR